MAVMMEVRQKPVLCMMCRWFRPILLPPVGRRVGFAWAGRSCVRLRSFVPVEVSGTPVAPAAGGRMVYAPRSWKASRADG